MSISTSKTNSEAPRPDLLRIARHILARTLDDPASGLGRYGQPEFKQALIEDVLAEVGHIEAAEQPWRANRSRLANYAVLAAKYQVLILPAAGEDEHEVTGLRGQPGITGDLKAHILTIAAADPFIQETANTLDERTAQTLYEACLFRYWVAWLRAQVFDGLRVALKDVPPAPAGDWYRPFYESMCAFQEYSYRAAVRLPQVLGRDDQAAGTAAWQASQFLRAVLAGAPVPGPEWREDE